MRIGIIQFDPDVSAGTYGRWLEEWGVACSLVGPDSKGFLRFEEADALLLLGGHMGVGDREDHPLLQEFHALLPGLVARGMPVLGICLGGQLLADALGGRATARSRGERGVRRISLSREGECDPLFAGLPNPFVSFQWHYDSFDLPASAIHLASTGTCPAQAFRCQNAYGLQFHPEVDEPIIAGWCRRAGVDDAAVKEFREVHGAYQAASRKMLQNFLAML